MASCVSSRLLTSSRVAAQRKSRRTSLTQPLRSSSSVSSGNSRLGGVPTSFRSTSNIQQRRTAAISISGSDLAFLSTTSNGANTSEESTQGWTKWELMASTILALAATGTFMISAVSAKQQQPRINVDLKGHATGGGGGGVFPGGGGGGGGPVQSNALLLTAPGVMEEEMQMEHPTVSLTKPSGRKSYDVSVRALRGRRLTMEDEYFIGDAGRFVGVFDGHGGGDVSHHLREELFRTFNKQLEPAKWEQQPDVSLPPSLSVKVTALRAAFGEVESNVIQRDSMQYQGSTAVAVLLHDGEDGHRTLLSANVGDSRAILSRKRMAVELTTDHKPNQEREKARILAMGETIEWDHFCKVHRVKNLSLSRAIGDRFAKPTVSAEVEIKRFPVEDDGDEFILLASDGLWDVMTSQDVVSFVHKKMEAHIPSSGMSDEDVGRLKYARRKNMSHYVATEALKLGSADNVCVVMVWLNEPDFKQSTR